MQEGRAFLRTSRGKQEREELGAIALHLASGGTDHGKGRQHGKARATPNSNQVDTTPLGYHPSGVPSLWDTIPVGFHLWDTIPMGYHPSGIPSF